MKLYILALTVPAILGFAWSLLRDHREPGDPNPRDCYFYDRLWYYIQRNVGIRPQVRDGETPYHSVPTRAQCRQWSEFTRSGKGVRAAA